MWTSGRALDAQTAALSQAASLDHQAKYAQEATVLNTYLATSPPKPYRYTPLMDLGNLSLDQRQDARAVSFYKQAVADDRGHLTLIDAESIALAATSAGDNSVAIAYYRDAIKLTPVDPNVSNNIAEYKQTIKDLGGTP